MEVEGTQEAEDCALTIARQGILRDASSAALKIAQTFLFSRMCLFGICWLSSHVKIRGRFQLKSQE